jgi:hypothetical protein
VYVGQEEQSPEDAAAQAAYDEALDSDLPPRRNDVKNVAGAAGGAAAGAACVAYGAAIAAPLCASIGSAIGEYLGGAIYDIFDGFFAGEEYVAPQYDHVFYQRTRKAAIRLAQQRLGRAPGNPDILIETQELEDWGVPGATLAAGLGPTAAERGPWRPYFSESGADKYLKKLAAAESARASAIITAQKIGRHPPVLRSTANLRREGASLTTVVVATAAAGGALWLLASLV